MSKVAILGAGITGLTAAYALKKKGHSVHIFEKNSFAGGVIQTLHLNDFLIELGPSTLQLNDSRVLDLLNEIKLDLNIIDTHPAARKRFIVKNNQLIPLPHSLKTFINTPLFSASAKWRLLKEPFIKKGNTDESVSQFIERRLGKEILDYAVNPFISGAYAGDPSKLSIKHAFPRLYNLEHQYGSLFKGLFKKKKNPSKIKTRTISFTHGMATLPLKLAELLQDSLYLNSKIISISYQNDSWTITVKFNGKTHTDTYSKLIVTLPANQLSTLPFANNISQELLPLHNIQYVGICVLTQVFRHASINHPLDGFGMLIPSKEKYKILGTLFSSSMFPQHTSENFHVLRTFIGGTCFPNIIEINKKAAEGLALKELTKLLGIKEAPIYSHYHLWESAIAQYNLGYEVFFHTMENAQRVFPSLHLMGSFRDGISLPQCILAGLNAPEFLK